MNLQILNENIVDLNTQLDKWFVVFDNGAEWFDTKDQAVQSAKERKNVKEKQIVDLNTEENKWFIIGDDNTFFDTMVEAEKAANEL